MQVSKLDVGSENLISDYRLEAMERFNFFCFSLKSVPTFWPREAHRPASHNCISKTDPEVFLRVPCSVRVGVAASTKIGINVKREKIIEDLEHEDSSLKLVDVLDFKEVMFLE